MSIFQAMQKKGFSFVFIAIVAVFAISVSHFPAKHAATPQTIAQEDSLLVARIIVAGDAMTHSPQLTWAKDSAGAYNFLPCFQYLTDILSQADLNVVNLETTLAGAPYSGYPQFCAPDEFAQALKNTGFNFFLLANNHCADKGTKGTKRTIEKLQNMDIPSTGAFLDAQDRQTRYPAIVEVQGLKIALLNYTYGTNGLTVTPPVSINDLNDTVQIKKDIKEAQDKQPDVIIAFLHWGAEYQRQPNKQQKEQAAFFFQQGVDVIVGSHPHVVQPMEYFAYDNADTSKKKLVYWSLGNLISNQRKEHTDGGIMASFSIVKDKNSQVVSVENHTAIPYWVYRNTAIPPGYFVLPTEHFLNDTTTFPFSTEDSAAFHKFVENTHPLFQEL